MNINFNFQINFRVQQLAVTGTELSDTHRCNLNIISIALLSLVCHVTGVQNLSEYASKIIVDRDADARYLLPPLHETNDKFNLNVPQLMIDKVSVQFELPAKKTMCFLTWIF